MQKNIRIIRLTNDYVIGDFDCGNSDLNDFLLHDAKSYANRLLAVTYLLVNDTETIAFFSVSNDRISIKESDKATWRRIKKEFPYSKHRSDYPAVKIGRLGVCESYQGNHIGRMILNFVKDTFINNNRTGCAFITVDALQDAIPFYQKNGFMFLQASIPIGSYRDTIPMYYDLSKLL